LPDETLATTYVYGDDLISQTKLALAGPSVTSVYHYDGLGTTRALSAYKVDAAGVPQAEHGEITDRYAYTAFGESDPAGTSGDTSGSSENNYRYTGEQLDPNLGFYYLRARYMDPGQGRFLGMDGFGGRTADPPSLHRYFYSYDNPINHIDPSGRLTLVEVGNSVNIAGNLYTAASITFNVLSGNYVGAGREIVEEVVYAKLGQLKKVAQLSEAAMKLFGRIWGKTVRLKLGYPKSGPVLRHNMEELLGRAPANHQAHHIVGEAFEEGQQARRILNDVGIDVNSVSNGVFLPDCTLIGAASMGSIHCGKHNRAYEKLVLESLQAVGGSQASKAAIVNALDDIRLLLLSGEKSLNVH